MFSSTSSSSSSSMEKATKYDVFLSFRGLDTRLGFVSHLYKDLKHKKVETFIDDDKLGRGEGISNTLLEAIKESRGSVIVFSHNYASSKWCLDELVQIMQCKKLKPQHYFVLPVFYCVEPSHVRNQTGSFSYAFAEHEETFKHDVKKVETWRSALKEAADLSGWDSQVTRPEATLVDGIVKDILKKLNIGASCAYLKDYVGIERRMKQIMLLFRRENPYFLNLGIWGMAGIGKTTLAEAIFNCLSIDFESSYFLRDVRGSEERGTLHELREKFLPAILDDGNLNISAPTILSDFHKVRLSRKKVLVVCDDVTNSSQLDFLFRGIDRFRPGSRVIVTTRDKQVLIQNGIDLIYEVEELDKAESVQLFCRRAFGGNHPKEVYQFEISNVVLSFANGNPLAIKVYGSSLYGKNRNYQENAVKKLREVPNPGILKLLRSSLDGLDSEERNMFLDIACLYKGEDRDFVTSIMDACYVSVHSGIDNLIDKSLISVWGNKIAMHDLLQQMCQDIERNESPSEPERRCRLWNPDDIYKVLIENNGAKALQGMLLDTSRIRELELKPEAFENMPKLKFLKFYFPYGKKSKILLPQGLLSLPDALRYLCWTGYPLKTLPTRFDPRNLVQLDMTYSNVELLWEGRQDLVNLKKINLSNSRNLAGIPDLSSATNLEEMVLTDCSKLFRFPEVSSNVRRLHLGGTAIEQVPSSIEFLTQLVRLSMNNCGRLKNFPTKICNLRSLRFLSLCNCPNITTFPEISANIEELDLVRTAIEEVPSSIERLSNLCKLNLTYCWKLKRISTSIHKLKSLRVLYLGYCSRLEKFPEILEAMERLRSLDLSGTALKELPSSMGNLIGLVELKLENCVNLVCLPGSFYKLKSLMKLRLGGCSRLENFPEILEAMETLEHLDLSGTALKELPSSMGNLIGLFELKLNNCKNLVCLTDNFYKLKSLPALHLGGCSRLEKFPEILEAMERLGSLDLSGTALKELPSSMENLIGLFELNLKNCVNLVCLPDSLSKLKSLRTLCLGGCSRLENFPEILEAMERLGSLDLSGTALKELPSSMENLIGLFELNLKNCVNLVCLPNSLSKLKSLRTLCLGGCSRLENFPEILEAMERLRNLDLSGTALKELPTSVENLIGPFELNLKNCVNLVCLPDSLYKLKSLGALRLEGCSRLENFPEILEAMETLEDLDLSGTALKELPSSMENLIGLFELNLKNCVNLVCLPNSLSKLKSLSTLRLGGCSRLEKFPEILEAMERLRTLDLSETALKELPTSVENLIGLVKLSLENCENLVCLPDSLFKLKSLMKLYLGGCSRLENFPEILESMERLRILDLSGTALKELPSSMENLIGLSELNLKNCENLVCLPKSLSKLKSLWALCLGGCSRLEKFPQILEAMESLRILDLCGTALKELPELPPRLLVLDAPGCTSLEDVSSIKRHFEKVLGDDYHLAIPCRVCISGNEVPKWFEFKSVGSSINIPLPGEWYNNRRKSFQGFVFSAVISIQDHSSDMNMHIGCHLKSSYDDHLDLSFSSADSWSSGMHYEHRLPGSDHLFIFSDDYSGRYFFETQASNEYIYYNEVSFKFYAQVYHGPYSSWKVKQCGAHLLFAEDGAKVPTRKIPMFEICRW